MTPAPTLDAIYVGLPKTITDDQGTWTSSIYRDRIEGPIELRKNGLVGNRVAQSYHGGPDAAVCVHLRDHYRFWNEHYDMALSPGYVGENFVLDNITSEQVCVGDIVRVGTAMVQVSGPRIPCANLARRIGRADWVKLTVRENRTGFYLRVLEPGIVASGNVWDLQERLNPDGSISAVNRCAYLNFDPAFARQIMQMDGLDPGWQALLGEKLSPEAADHWTGTMVD
jgi:MOSC domain-containing protein YiiM